MLEKSEDVSPWTEDQLCVQESLRNCPRSPAAASRVGLTPAERNEGGKGLAARLVAGLKAESRPELRFESGPSDVSPVLIMRRLRGLIELEADGESAACAREDDETWDEDLARALLLRSVMITENSGTAARGSDGGLASVL